MSCTHLSSKFSCCQSWDFFDSHIWTQQMSDRRSEGGGGMSFEKGCLLAFVLWIVLLLNTDLWSAATLSYTVCYHKNCKFRPVLSSPLTTRRKTCQDRHGMICRKLSVFDDGNGVGFQKELLFHCLRRRLRLCGVFQLSMWSNFVHDLTQKPIKVNPIRSASLSSPPAPQMR